MCLRECDLRDLVAAAAAEAPNVSPALCTFVCLYARVSVLALNSVCLSHGKLHSARKTSRSVITCSTARPAPAVSVFQKRASSILTRPRTHVPRSCHAARLARRASGHRLRARPRASQRSDARAITRIHVPPPPAPSRTYTEHERSPRAERDAEHIHARRVLHTYTHTQTQTQVHIRIRECRSSCTHCTCVCRARRPGSTVAPSFTWRVPTRVPTRTRQWRAHSTRVRAHVHTTTRRAQIKTKPITSLINKSSVSCVWWISALPFSSVPCSCTVS